MRRATASHVNSPDLAITYIGDCRFFPIPVGRFNCPGVGSMTEAEFVWLDEGMTQTSGGARGAYEIDLCDTAIIVLDGDGHVTSTNTRARDLLRAESPSMLEDRLQEIQHHLALAPDDGDSMDETSVELPGVGPLGIRSCAVNGAGGAGRVLLLRDGRSLPGTTNLLRQAARHRSFVFLSRDWAHDLKGMLNVIRINGALLARLLQDAPAASNPAVTKCLDTIPREVDRLDRTIDAVLSARSDERESAFDLGATCARLENLIAARAMRQRVEVVLDVQGGVREIVGFEDQILGALLNVVVNALEAMPEQGRLLITVGGDTRNVSIRICDSGPGMQPRPSDRLWRPHFVNDGRRTGIGLHVTRAIVESHGGRIECASNVPPGTCVEIYFPTAASTGRFLHGSRTHR